MKKYYVSYRGEFAIEVIAESEEDAIHKVDCGLAENDWEQTGELHRSFLEVIDEDEL